MTFGSEIREVAQELTEEFSEELGMSTLVYVDSQTYDTETGSSSETTTSKAAYMTFTKIESAEVSDESFIKKHQKVIVAGDDLDSAPSSGDRVIKFSGSEHRIVSVNVDQYKAAYIMYIEKKAVET